MLRALVLIGFILTLLAGAALASPIIVSQRTSRDPGASSTPVPAGTPVAGAPTVETATPEPTPSPTPAVTPQATPVTSPEPAATPSPEPTGVGGPQRDVRWEQAVKRADGARFGYVTVDVLNIRSAPSLDAPVVGTTYYRYPVPVFEQVPGDVVEGNPSWYRIGEDRYVSAAMVEPLIPTAPVASYDGHWVDINLGTFYAIAYDGSTPVNVAIIIAGRSNRTPPGEFEILYRVRSETMDSATVGIPKGHPEYYYLPNVPYTQYFAAGGFALHGNYWSTPDSYGRFGSNGCVNLMERDAAWFWDFLSVGSRVSIHY